MTLADLASLATVIALVVGAASLVFTAYQTLLSRRATAASVTLTASEAFRDAWSRLDANEGEPAHHRAAFADLMNLIEACCAIHRDKMLVGRSGRLLETYLVNTLTQIEQSDRALELLAGLLETERTFEEIAHFLTVQRRARRDFLARLKVFTGGSAPHLSKEGGH